MFAPVKKQIAIAKWPTQIAAGTDDTQYFQWLEDGTSLISAVKLVPDSTSATNGTDYQIITVYNVTQSRTIAVLNTSAASWTAGTPVTVTMDTGAKAGEIAKNDIVSIAMTHAGAGKVWRGTVLATVTQIAG